MLKISKEIIAPFLSYSIFLRGLFFMPHPVYRGLWYTTASAVLVFKTVDFHRAQSSVVSTLPIQNRTHVGLGHNRLSCFRWTEPSKNCFGNWHQPVFLTLSDPRGTVLSLIHLRTAGNKGYYDLWGFLRSGGRLIGRRSKQGLPFEAVDRSLSLIDRLNTRQAIDFSITSHFQMASPGSKA